MNRFSYLTGTERVGVIVAIVAIMVAILIAISTGVLHENGQTVVADTTRQQLSDTSTFRYKHGNKYYYATPTVKHKLFRFDPNTADSTSLLSLGLQPWQVRNIYKYRAAGGIFRRKADFKRIYGLTRGQYARLEPYISIGADYQPISNDYVKEHSSSLSYDTIKHSQKLNKGEHVAINTADTSLLKRVPGIGSYYARRIVDYRNRLGGYYSVAQLKEINGFPDAALPYMQLGTAVCRKININKSSLSQMRQHPYFSYYIAHTIVEHRRLHGRINSLNDLKLYRDFTPETISRLEKYVEF